MIGVTTTIAVFALLCVLTYLCFASSTRTLKLIGPSGLSIVTRLLGLILAVIGTQMLIEGTLDALASAQNAQEKFSQRSSRALSVTCWHLRYLHTR
ncbi:MAG: MarC family protein [Pseudomonadota bacterium]